MFTLQTMCPGGGRSNCSRQSIAHTLGVETTSFSARNASTGVAWQCRSHIWLPSAVCEGRVAKEACSRICNLGDIPAVILSETANFPFMVAEKEVTFLRRIAGPFTRCRARPQGS